MSSRVVRNPVSEVSRSVASLAPVTRSFDVSTLFSGITFLFDQILQTMRTVAVNGMVTTQYTQRYLEATVVDITSTSGIHLNMFMLKKVCRRHR
jgi:hypothetical protein